MTGQDIIDLIIKNSLQEYTPVIKFYFDNYHESYVMSLKISELIDIGHSDKIFLLEAKERE